MAETSKIEWTHATFNPWRGCSKVSPGCAKCYAETMSLRNPAVLGKWGDNGTRIIASESYWRQPLKWDREAAAAGERRRVFCASLADVFEERRELIEPRQRLFELIGQTPNLDWLLLTKRPQVAVDHWPLWAGFALGGAIRKHLPIDGLLRNNLVIPNVWLGVSVEDQQRADERIPLLLQTPAAVRFLSVEPLLGPIEFSDVNGIHWIIVGGESGAGARPMHPWWAQSIRDQCQAAGIAFFFKQWGEYAPLGKASGLVSASGARVSLASGIPMDEPTSVFRVGKKLAGRLLDGREWSEFPEVSR